MENQTKKMSTLIGSQQDESTKKVEGFCGKAYSSNDLSCSNAYSVTSPGSSGTSEELDILI